MPIQCASDTVNNAKAELRSLVLYWILSHLTFHAKGCTVNDKAAEDVEFVVWLFMCPSLIIIDLEGMFAKNRVTVSVVYLHMLFALF